MWRELATHNAIEPPYELAVGTRIRIPVALLVKPPAPARVRFARGEAEVVDGHGRRLPLAGGEDLRMGERIVTGDGSVTVEFADGSLMLLGAESEAVLDALSEFGATGMVDTRIRLVRGSTESNVQTRASGASHYRISTSSGVAAVRGTRFRVRAAASDASPAFAEVAEGGIAFDTSQAAIDVDQGFGVAVAKDQPPPPVEALLEAPSVTAAQSRFTLPADVNWAPVASSTGYKYLVFEGAGTERLLREGRMGALSRMTLDELSVGHYTFGLRAIAPSGLEGLQGEFEFDVVPEPPNVVLAGVPYGSVEPLGWAAVDRAGGYHVQVARDPQFTQLLRDERVPRPKLAIDAPMMPGNYFLRAATVEDGVLGAYSQPAAFAVELRALQLRASNIRRRSTHVGWQLLPGVNDYLLQISESLDFATPTLRIVEGTRSKVDSGRRAVWVRVAPRLRRPDGTIAIGPMSEPLKVRAIHCLTGRASVGTCR